MKKIITLFAILVLFACNNGEKSRLTFETIQRGTEVLKTYISFCALDTVSVHTDAQLLDSALQIHKMSRDEITMVIEYFKKNPAKFNDELTGINEFIDKLKVE